MRQKQSGESAETSATWARRACRQRQPEPCTETTRGDSCRVSHSPSPSEPPGLGPPARTAKAADISGGSIIRQQVVWCCPRFSSPIYSLPKCRVINSKNSTRGKNLYLGHSRHRIHQYVQPIAAF